MKKLILTVSGLLLGAFLFTSCLEDDPDELDDAIAGKYGGVVAGSSGYYVVDLQPRSNGLATLYFDGYVYHLKTADKVNGVSFHNLRFSTSDDQIVMYFSAEENGLNPSVTFEIPGHNVVATIDHYGPEDSSLSLYQGSSYSASGSNYIMYTFNIALNYSDNTFEAVSAVRATNTSTPEGQTDAINGTFSISGNSLTLSYNGETLNGTIAGQTIHFDQPGFTMTGSEVAAGGEITPQASLIGKWIPYLFYNGSPDGSSILFVDTDECPQGKYVEIYENATYKDVWWEIIDGQCEDVGDSDVVKPYVMNGNGGMVLDETPFSIVELSDEKLIIETYSEDNGQHYYFKGEYHREK